MYQRRIPAVFMRGGTSKALMFHRCNLPDDTELWPELFVAALGANDPYGRQLDGMGGGLSSLSKVCVISPSSRPGIDIDYTFFQLTPTTDSVDVSASCGNMAAAVLQSDRHHEAFAGNQHIGVPYDCRPKAVIVRPVRWPDLRPL